MPFSIPTAAALNFVGKRPLQDRIRALQTSYKIQFAGFSTFTLFNFIKPLTTLNQTIVKIGSIPPI